MIDGNETGDRYYIGNMEYNQTQTLEFIHTSEGRVRYNGVDYAYDYYLKDHLGNTRTVFADGNGDGILADNEVLQETHYYPFGMSIGDLAVDRGADNKIKFGAKELQDDVLNGVKLNLYDYNTRYYMPDVPVFTTNDLLSETYSFQSTYAYAINNPIRFTDFLGMGPEDEVKRKKETDVKLVAYCLRQGLQLASMAVSQYSSLFGAAGDAIGVTEGQLLPNPDYASMDLTIAETSLEISLSNGDFEDFTEVVTDVNNTLEEYDLNMIDSYLLSDEQLDQLTNGDITLDDLTDSKVDADDLTSEMDMEGNEDKINVLFNRPDEEGFSENQFLVNGTIALFKKGEEVKKEDETKQ